MAKSRGRRSSRGGNGRRRAPEPQRRPARGTVLRERVHGQALEGNPWDDDTTRDLFVYLPPGYSDTGDRYPVVLVLTGFLGIGENPWQRKSFGESLQERMDRLIAEGRVPPMILATPDCFTSLGGSQYLDSPALGRYETFIVEDVVPYLDEHFHTAATARHRAVVGKSSGGYGALMLGMRHPKLFGVIASHAGDSYFDYCYRLDFVTCWNELRNAGGVERWFDAFRKKEKLGSKDVATLNIVAMSAAYSPDRSQPLGLQLPFDMDTGAELPEVMDQWRRHDPVVRCEDYADALAGMRGIYLDCGLRDEWALHVGTRVLSRRLTELGIDHHHEEFDDGHMGISYRYDVSLPFVGERIAVR